MDFQVHPSEQHLCAEIGGEGAPGFSQEKIIFL